MPFFFFPSFFSSSCTNTNLGCLDLSVTVTGTTASPPYMALPPPWIVLPGYPGDQGSGGVPRLPPPNIKLCFEVPFSSLFSFVCRCSRVASVFSGPPSAPVAASVRCIPTSHRACLPGQPLRTRQRSEGKPLLLPPFIGWWGLCHFTDDSTLNSIFGLRLPLPSFANPTFSSFLHFVRSLREEGQLSYLSAGHLLTAWSPAEGPFPFFPPGTSMASVHLVERFFPLNTQCRKKTVTLFPHEVVCSKPLHTLSSSFAIRGASASNLV